MPSSTALFLCLINTCLLASLPSVEDGTVFYNFEVSYITASPLAVPQHVIAINKLFPGPTINTTTNNYVQWRSSWQDGVLGTNCPTPPKWNWTYQFQFSLILEVSIKFKFDSITGITLSVPYQLSFIFLPFLDRLDQRK
ncbi:hypothetical protein K1719_022471 [Acacia pycnantha]|nr:hypothetical protein K1719_047278 [Acacia pycnantha]KAI9106943.1 hypothetical protein K1719_022471 [Acacia pycnantha]